MLVRRKSQLTGLLQQGEDPRDLFHGFVELTE
jgi:hypothetical protein